MPIKLTFWYSAAGQGLSIHARTLLSVSIVLIVFLSIAGIVFDRYFVANAENNLREQLQNHLYALLAAANEDQQGRMRLPAVLPDPKLNLPDSDLVAWVDGEEGSYQWYSGSYLGKQIKQKLAEKQSLQPGVFHYRSKIENLAQLSFAIIWEDLQGHEILYSLQVVINRAAIEEQIQGFRQVLWWWFGGLIVLLLLIQGMVLNWGLRPLRQASDELQAIENGKQEKLSANYPHELLKLTDNINSLLQHSSASLQRYRNSLGDLAHSLKTPLAVMQGAYDSQHPEQLRCAASEQLQRIDELIAYQLQKARIMGDGPVTIATPVQEVFNKVIRALDKVYADKSVCCTFNPPSEVLFRGDQGDLLEVVGNLLDNAYKYCQRQVQVEISAKLKIINESSFFSFSIIDDGAGIPEQQQELLLQRGRRADQRCLPAGAVGHGIGLSIVAEIVHQYGGKFSLSSNQHEALQGLQVQILLPAICPD